MPPERIPKVAFTCRQKERGRPKTTWRKTAGIELSEMGLTWGEAQAIVKDKTQWRRDIVAALCSNGDYKDL